MSKATLPAAADEPAAAADDAPEKDHDRAGLKLGNLSKFDATPAAFNRYNIKLKATAKLNGCGDAIKAKDEDVKKAELGDGSKLGKMMETLYTIIILTIADDTASGEDLLTILAANCEANDTDRKIDNGSKAYKMLVERFAGQSKQDTTALFTKLNKTKLVSDDVQKYEADIVSIFNMIAASGVTLGDSQKKAFFLTGLSGNGKWDYFVQHVHQFDATNEDSTFNMLLAMFHTMTPIIIGHDNKSQEQAYFTKEKVKKKFGDTDWNCYRCGGKCKPYGHHPKECPAIEMECLKCEKKGHLANVCKTKLSKQKPPNRKGAKKNQYSRDDKALAAVLTKTNNKIGELSAKVDKMSVGAHEGGDSSDSSAEPPPSKKRQRDKVKKVKDKTEDDKIEFAGAIFKVVEENPNTTKGPKQSKGFRFSNINKLVMLLSIVFLVLSCGLQWVYGDASIINSEIDSVLAASDNYELWQHDSACTSHMAGTKASDWTNYSQIVGGKAIGIGGAVDAVSKGTQVRYLETRKGNYVRIKMEVKEVPRLGDMRLLSEPAIEDNTSLLLMTKWVGKGKSKVKEKYYLTPDGEEVPIKRVGREFHLKLYKSIPENKEFCNMASIDDLDQLTLQHLRLGHRNKSNIISAIEKGAIDGVSIGDLSLVKQNLKHETLPRVCEGCEFGKKHKVTVSKEKPERATKRLQLVHMDWIGPIRTASIAHHCKYALVFTDDCTRVSRVYCTRRKSDGLDALKKFRQDVEDDDHKLQVLQADNAPEFMKGKFGSYCTEHGINQRWSLPYRQWQNGVAERVNRTLCEMANCMLHTAGLSMGYWELALKQAVYIYNRSMHSALPNITPYEAWHNAVPNLSDIKIFGSPAYALVDKENRNGQFTYSNATKGLYVGHSLYHKSSNLIYIPNKNIVLARLNKEATIDERAMFEMETPQNIAEEENPFLIDATKAEEFHNAMNLEPENGIALDAESPIPAPKMHDATEARPQARPSVPPAQSIKPQTLDFESIGADASGGVEDQATELRPQSTRESRRMERLSRNLGTRGDDGPKSIFKNPIYDSVSRVAFTLLMLTDHALMTKNVMAPDANLASNYSTPNTYSQATTTGSAADKERWEKSIHKELSGLENCNCWELANLPPNRKAIGAKWVFKVKQTATGEVDKFKARCVAKGYSQVHGVDFDETYAPVCKSTSVNHLLAKSALENLVCHHMDVDQAFIQSPMHEEIYLELPEGYAKWKGCSKKKVLRILKGLYGLKQSGRSWNKTIEETFIKDLGFKRFESDICLFKKVVDGQDVYIALYVDDLIIAAPNTKQGLKALAKVKGQLRDKYSMTDLGKLQWFLGMKINQSDDCASVSIDQSRYIEDVAKKFGVENAKVSTPMDDQLKLSREDSPKVGSPEHEEVAKLPYKALIGCLLYISGKTRPDITFAVHTLARFSQYPSLKAWNAALRVLKYLHCTKDMKITYSRDGNSNVQVISETKQVSWSKSWWNKLTSWADSNWGGDLDTMRSTTGYIVMLAGAAISWNSRLQPTVALSSTEAEYMACTSVVQEVIHQRMLQEEFGNEDKEPTLLMEDNQGCIHMAKAQGNHKRVKHLDLKIHFVRQAVEAGTVVLQYIPTNDQLADMFTKALPKQRFEVLRNKIMNVPSS